MTEADIKSERKTEYDAIVVACDTNSPAIRPGQAWLHTYKGEIYSASRIEASGRVMLPNYGREWRSWIISTIQGVKTRNNPHGLAMHDMGLICEFNLRMFYELDEQLSEPYSLIPHHDSVERALELLVEARAKLPAGAYDQEVGEPFEAALAILERIAP